MKNKANSLDEMYEGYGYDLNDQNIYTSVENYNVALNEDTKVSTDGMETLGRIGKYCYDQDIPTENDNKCVEVVSFVSESNMKYTDMRETRWECGTTPPVPPIVPQYRTLSTATTCVGIDKHTLEEYQVSYDNGATWTTTATSATTIIEANSYDCGYRTRTTSGSPYCSGVDKYFDVFDQVSTDYGVTWITTATTPTLIERNSADCGYVPPSGSSILGVFNVTSTTSPTQIAFDTSSFKAIMIDGVEPPSIASSYTFDTSGEHTVEFFLADPTTINASAFTNCGDMVRVEMPSTISGIGDGAFKSCTSLTRIVINSATPPTLGTDVFDDTNNCPIYVPTMNYDDYKALWTDYSNKIMDVASVDGLQLIALEDCTFGFYFENSSSVLSYSLDDGYTWNAYNHGDTVNVPSGSTIRWTGTCISDGYGIGSFQVNGRFEASGNVMSLIYGDNYEGKTVLNSDGTFYYLFAYTNIVSAKYLALPATALTINCYSNMFNACYSLTTAPQLHAETLAENCYQYMFTNCTGLTVSPLVLPAETLEPRCYDSMFAYCTSLETSPQFKAMTLADYCCANMFSDCNSMKIGPLLPATTLADGCYSGMFNSCHNLERIPVLPALEMKPSCYSSMFSGCWKMETAPELPSVELAEDCYTSMFSYCSGLTEAPELNATVMARSCYYQMFQGCTSLTVAPELPATTLADYCYSYMFSYCTSLTAAPELLATTLYERCYSFMFQDCTSLNRIKCLATDISASNCTYRWVDGVPTGTSGTFIKAASMNSWPSGNNGIPSGWVIQDA